MLGSSAERKVATGEHLLAIIFFTALKVVLLGECLSLVERWAGTIGVGGGLFGGFVNGSEQEGLIEDEGQAQREALARASSSGFGSAIRLPTRREACGCIRGEGT